MSQHQTRRLRGRHRKTRRGTATVELAVSLPLLVLITLGTIETCTAIFTKQALQSAALECARVAARPSGTNEEVEATLDEFARLRGLNNPTVSFSPNNVEKASPGELITVTVSAKPSENSFIKHHLFGDSVDSSCTMVKAF